MGGASCPDWKSRALEVAPTKEKRSGFANPDRAGGGCWKDKLISIYALILPTPVPVGGASCPDWKSRDLEVAPTKEKRSGFANPDRAGGGLLEGQVVGFRGAQSNLQIA